MDMSTLYWLTRLDGLHTAFSYMILPTLGITFISLLVIFVHYIDKKLSVSKKWFLLPVGSAVLLGTCILGNVLTPTNKELGVILGGYYASNSEEYSKLPNKAGKVINKFMDSYLEEKKEQ